MARIVAPLSNTAVVQAKPRDKEYNLSDGEGLMLRVKPNGSKLWLFNYTHPFTKKRKNISFGPFPDVTLAQAREKKREARACLAGGDDPKEVIARTQQAKEEEYNNTLQIVASEWFKIKKTRVTPDYADDIWRSLQLHLFPALANVPLSKITATNTIAVLKPLAAKGSLETLRRLCQRLNEIMTFAVNTGIIFNNPLSGISHAFQPPKRKNMATLRPEELPELMQALSHASIKRTTRCLIEWQLHTVVRPSEAAGARWDEIDWDNRLWTIPAERMKKKRPHIVPLSNQVIRLLDVLRPISGHREFLFPSDRNPKTHANSQTANMALKRMGFGGRLVSHGLRALASTALNEHGFEPDLIEAVLAHEDRNEVRRAYNRADYIERRRTLMRWWSAQIELAASGNMSLSHLAEKRGVMYSSTGPINSEIN